MIYPNSFDGAAGPAVASVPARTARFSDASGEVHARRVLNAAVEILQQGEGMLGGLTAEQYVAKIPFAFNASIGGHYRHCLDHFASWWRGVESGLIDYDHRERDRRLEQDPELARSVTRRLRERLQGLSADALARPIAARCEVSYDHGDSPVTLSTVGRELVYAIAHGIHHYALIAVMARLQQAELPATFGVAPSTVAHEKTAPAP